LSGKSVSITYSESEFVALVIKHAMLVRQIVIGGLPGSAHKRDDFFFFGGGGEVTESEMCVLVFSTNFV
jgi:hypothetical protein